VHLRVDDQHDAAALAAVAAVRAAERLELLPMYRCSAIAAVAGARVDHHTVNEPGCHLTSSPSHERFPVTREEKEKLPRGETSWQLHTSCKRLGLDRDDVDRLATALGAEEHRAGGRGEQGVVATATDVHARVKVSAALTDEDLAGLDDLAAEALDAQSLGGGIATVTRA